LPDFLGTTYQNEKIYQMSIKYMPTFFIQRPIRCNYILFGNPDPTHFFNTLLTSPFKFFFLGGGYVDQGVSDCHRGEQEFICREFESRQGIGW
jgi:hypothetical protein